MQCAYCSQRKGKRECPALGSICSSCCGKHRRKEVQCPADCAYLPAPPERDELHQVFDRLQAELLEFTFDLDLRQDRRGLDAIFGTTHRTYQDWEQPVVLVYLAYGHVDRRGERAVDVFLRERAAGFTPLEREVLAACAAAVPAVVEVQAVRRGEGLEVEDVLTGQRRFVHEKALTTQLQAGANLLAWEVTLAGKHEFMGVAPIPPAHVRVVRSAFAASLERRAAEDPGSTPEQRARLAAADAHRALREAIRTYVPRARDADGQEVAPSWAAYEVVDADAVVARLSDHPDVLRTGPTTFSWLGPPGREGEAAPVLEGEDVPTFSMTLSDPRTGVARRVLGMIELRTIRLSLLCMVPARLVEGRRLLERLLGRLVKHRYDRREALADVVARGRLGRRDPALSMQLPCDPEVPLGLAIQRWLDEHPEAAARLEAQVAERQLALDASARAPGARSTPGREELRPLPHELLDVLVPGLGAAVASLARAERAKPGWEGRTIDHARLPRCEALQEVLATHARHLMRDEGWSEDAAVQETNLVGSHAYYAANHELHHRKTFWVDDALAWALHETTLDVPGACLKLPFPSAAFVFADPATRELADSLLTFDGPSRPRAVLRMTVYVVQGERRAAEADLRMSFLFELEEGEHEDDDDWPYLVARDLVVRDEDRLDGILDSHPEDDATTSRDTIFRAPEMKKLVHLVINAILYATSAHQPSVELPRPPRRKAGGAVGRRSSKTYTDDDVFFLPGTIDISGVKRLQQLEHDESGRTVLRRYLVRGHWRRAAPGWSDQRLRWIEPYWKGPDLGMVIERAYRLKP